MPPNGTSGWFTVDGTPIGNAPEPGAVESVDEEVLNLVDVDGERLMREAEALARFRDMQRAIQRQRVRPTPFDPEPRRQQTQEIRLRDLYKVGLDRRNRHYQRLKLKAGCKEEEDFKI